MESIHNFAGLVSRLSQHGQRKRVAVVCASDEATLSAVARALTEGFVEVIFVGCRAEVEACAALQSLTDHFSIVDAADKQDAAEKAVALAREGKVDLLMKGLINTDILLRAVLNKEHGILPKGRVLTHVTATEIPGYPKLVFFTDPAVIPFPSHDQRREQVRYVVRMCHALGIDTPRVSLIHCSEEVNAKYFPYTVAYGDLIREAKDGEFGDCVLDGPLDVKTSLDASSLETKGIQSPIAGQADALIFPDIEAGNTFYKTLTLFCKAKVATALQGTDVPVVVTSRSDNEETKYYSLALAATTIR